MTQDGGCDKCDDAPYRSKCTDKPSGCPKKNCKPAHHKQPWGCYREKCPSPATPRSRPLPCLPPTPSGCKGCSTACSPYCEQTRVDTVQKRIQNVVRISASEYAMNKAAMNVCQAPLPPSSDKYGYSRPQSMSDRREQHIVLPSSNVPRRRTRQIPGQQSAPGKGCDVKHFSYARYLARKKGCGPLRGENCGAGLVPCTPSFEEISGQFPAVKTAGGKYKKFGIISGCLNFTSGC